MSKVIIIRVVLDDEYYKELREFYSLADIRDAIKQAGEAELSVLLGQHQQDRDSKGDA